MRRCRFWAIAAAPFSATVGGPTKESSRPSDDAGGHERRSPACAVIRPSAGACVHAKALGGFDCTRTGRVRMPTPLPGRAGEFSLSRRPVVSADDRWRSPLSDERSVSSQ